MEINEDFIPSVREGIDLEELDDGCVLYNTKKDEVHGLNTMATFIWTCCDGKHSIKEIKTIIEESFKSESDRVLKDVIKSVKIFSGKELLA